ncbi:50S ribosomal protein LP1 [Fonticula alba]|uniref:50S ribosomal protein LP1 n=1 Tax=Fonticula alba TaxID=691883 RepID=A0A058ZEL2_FONAL|nr:50S ribosomal protein LP1 [Fonticula alba]KCV71892.1 50S ribosomal protein LP1 [Fonticula alba]|eukprot:XP_009493470.1 50S ribosomal protein LP1 [Fonticula alba]
MSTELACVYASLILHDSGLEVTADKIVDLTTAAGVTIEPIWATLFASALQGHNVTDLLSAAGSVGGGAAAAPVAAAGGAAAAAEEKKEEKVESDESDEDMGFGLFD